MIVADFRFYKKIRVKTGQQWLITERPMDARDNGYVLFKYLKNTHPELCVFYAINKQSPDYGRVEKLGNVVEWGSYRHYYLYFTSSIICATGFDIGCPSPYANLLTRHFLPTKSKRVFLQHGIISNYLPHALKRKLRVQLFVCGAYPEFQYVSQKFGYKKNEVKYLGLARYDQLDIEKTERNTILYMPTWRQWLNDRNLLGSTYYKRIASLLTSSELASFLKSKNTEFIYFIHPAIRKMKKYFQRFETSNIHIMNNDDCDLQYLLKSAKILITDFSSIFFDFAYMKKPVIYYHFDNGHYPAGYFDHERDGFGPVVYNVQQVINMIKNIEKNEWISEKKYLERVDIFFPLHDKDNCKRHYEELCQLEKQTTKG